MVLYIPAYSPRVRSSCMAFLVRCRPAAPLPMFWLCEGKRGYRWIRGLPGYQQAARFETQEDALAVIDSHGRYGGAAGVEAEIIQAMTEYFWEPQCPAK